MFENLPDELSLLVKYHPWAVTRGYLMQGVRALIWDRLMDADEYFSHVSCLESQMDDVFMQWLMSHLLAYESEYGTEAVLKILNLIASRFQKLGMANIHTKLKGNFFADKAFDKFQLSANKQVWPSVVRAVINDPSHLMNRGLMSVVLHSTPFLQFFAS
jgi:uncharacterized protein with PhoU and TrkA domain